MAAKAAHIHHVPIDSTRAPQKNKKGLFPKDTDPCTCLARTNLALGQGLACNEFVACSTGRLSGDKLP
jgi:hypothetical protein